MPDAVTADFISQKVADLADQELDTWFGATAAELRAQGATWLRFTNHPDNPRLHLVEGWKVRPAEEGEPHWLTHGPEEA